MQNTITAPLVRVTEHLRQDLESDSFDVQDFCELFAIWKSEWPKNEYDCYYFGKDGDYAEPKRHGRRVLRHVHLAPDDSNTDSAKDWSQKHERKSRKTSDNVLIYAEDPQHGYLLIYFAREPDGHKIADMTTPESRQLMENLADVAEAFIFNGEILI